MNRPDDTGDFSGRFVGLDLLRGLAAYGVVATHLAAPLSLGFGFDVEPVTGFGGRGGVELFFALSGFLIGGVLCDLKDHTATNYGIFLVRRWMRTLPVYYAAIAFFVLYPGIFEPEQISPRKLIEFLTFTQTFLNHDISWFRVSWTLVIEEWFYLFLTLAVAFATLVLRLRNGFLVAVVALIVAGHLLRLSPFVPTINVGMLGRVDAIAYGCLFAWLVRHGEIGRAIRANARAISLVCGIAFVGCYVMERHGLWPLGRFGNCVHYLAWGVSGAGLLSFFLVWSPRSRALIRFAALSAAVSYPVYIWHQAIIWVFWNSRANGGTGWLNVALVVLTSTAVAYAMHLAIERPFMRWRPKFRTSQPTDAAARLRAAE